MNGKSQKRIRTKAKKAVAPRKAPTRPKKPRGAAARKAETVRSERDAFARQILERIMPEFGPINFTKSKLFEEMVKHPTPDELIRQLELER
jgi:hypothetical protein